MGQIFTQIVLLFVTVILYAEQYYQTFDNFKHKTTNAITGISTISDFNKLYQDLYQANKSGGFIYDIYHKNGTSISTYNIGSWDLGGDAWAPDVLAPLWSMSKAVTAMGVVKLIEDGKMELDDPINKHIKTFKTPPVFVKKENDVIITEPANREITVRDLLTHTSGIGYAGVALLESAFKRFNDTLNNQQIKDSLEQLSLFPRSKEDLLHIVCTNPLAFQPGTGFQYSNGIDVLGVAITEITNISLNQQLSDIMFKPMGMTDISFYDQINFFKWHLDTADQFLIPLRHHTPFNVIPLPYFELGGQSIQSTLRDYKKFQLMLANKGLYNNKRIFNESTIENLVYKNLLPVEDISKLKLVGIVAMGEGAAKAAWSAPGQLDPKTGNFGWSGFGGCAWQCNQKNGICYTSWSNDLMPTQSGDLMVGFFDLISSGAL